MIKKKLEKLSVAKVFQRVCTELKINPNDIKDCKITDKYAFTARDLAIYFISNYTTASYNDISDFFGLTTRQSAYHAIKRIERSLNTSHKSSHIHEYCKKIEKSICNM